MMGWHKVSRRRGPGLIWAAAAVICGAASTASALDTIDFTAPGADPALDASLRGASLLLAAERDKQTDPQDLFAAALAEYGRLTGTLYATGHYSGVVHVRIDGREAATIPPLDTPARIGRIEVSVEPGPLFTFSKARVAPLARNTVLPDGFALGKPAESGVIRDAAQAGVDGWRDQGNAKAAVRSQDITANHANAQLSAQIALDPGPQLRFGKLSVRGAARMRPARVREIAGLPQGEVFSPADLNRAADRLRRSGVFQSVTLAEDEVITAPDLLGITATVVEEKRRRYSLGAEVASLDGLSLTGYWLHRNLFGGGERLRIDGAVGNIGATSSGVDYSLGVSIERPATFTPDTTVGIAASIGHEDEVDYSADVASFGVTVSHILSDKLTVRGGVSYDYSEGSDAFRDFRYRNLSIPLGATWDRRNSKVDATRGFYLDAEAKPFVGFGVTDSGIRLTLDGRAYRGLGAEERLVLAARVQAGAIYGASLLGAPRDYLFYSGGGGTVRGQPYQSLGVNVLRGFGSEFKTGGAFFLGTSLEARAKITKTIGIVGFVDVGQIGAFDFFDTGADWHAGAGLGLRYDTGFGPIRLDVAVPVGGTTGDGVQIYVGLGQSF
jgi:translocation and assembly module TamA